MFYKFTTFKGIAPAVAPRLLNERFGQTAENIDFESGVLVPIEDDGSSEFTLQNGLRRSIFLYEDTNWFEWADENVHAVPGPIANDAFDRVYWTDAAYPKMSTTALAVSGSSGYPATSYRLGIPAPTAAPSISKSGTASDDEQAISVAYVYCLVSEFGEEGPPSAASTVETLTSTETITLTLSSGSVPSGNYALSTGALKRIYRSNTGSNTTEFQFIADVPIATTSYADTTDPAAAGELIPSTYWVGPPDDDSSTYPDGPMAGIIPVGNGIFAGFSGNTICLSEPFLPHAWPVSYRINTEEDVVALETTAGGLVGLTDGRPYFISGVDPSAMSAEIIELSQACVNEHSVVDMGSYVLYAGPDGLCAVEANSGQIVSQGVISPAQWNADFNPTSYRAFRYEDTYVAFYSDGASEHSGWVFDPRAQDAVFSTLTLSSEVRGGHYDPKTGDLYMIVGSDIIKYRGGAGKRTLTWRTKELITPHPTDFGWVRVSAEAYPVTVKVYADDTLIADYSIAKSGSTYTQTTTTPGSISPATLTEPIMRLPATVGQKWEVEVESANTVNEVAIAQTIGELRSE